MRASGPSSPEFDRVIGGESRPDLARVALEIAGDFHPDLDVDAELARITALADRVRARCRPGAPVRKVLGQINWVLFVEEGFKGDVEEYDDPRNSFLNEVLDRKAGIPISLSILYATIAEQVGVPLLPVNLPAHFMLRLAEDEPTFVDAFHGGELLDRAACERRIVRLTGRPGPLPDKAVSACSAATVVARMLRNLKGLFVSGDDFVSAHLVQSRLAVVSDDPIEQRDLGMIRLQLDLHGEAIDPLAAYLRRRPSAGDAETVQALLSGARSVVAQWN